MTFDQQTSEISPSEFQASFPMPSFDKSEWRRAEIAFGAGKLALCTPYILALDFFAKFKKKVSFHVNAYRFGGNNLLQLAAGQLWI